MSHTPLYQAQTSPATRTWTHRRLFFLVIALAVLSLGAVGLGRGFATPTMVTDAAVETGSSGTDGSRPGLLATLRETFAGQPDVPPAAATATPAVTPSGESTAEVRGITGTAESIVTTPVASPTTILPSRVADNGPGQPSPVPAAVGTQSPSEVPRSAPAATTSSTPVVVSGTTPASAAPAPAPVLVRGALAPAAPAAPVASPTPAPAKPAAPATPAPAPAKPAAPAAPDKPTPDKPKAPGRPESPGKSAQPTVPTTP